MLDHAHAANPDLGNVTWVHGDGTTLAGIDDASADGVFCFVVLQHVPDSEVILGYVEEMGRVLKPGGWAAFQFSNDPQIHRPPSRTRALLDRSARRQKDPAWVGSAVDLSDMRGTLDSSGLRVERLLNEGTQFCLVHAVKEFARLPIT
jgi:ubiquinone/menaquinone biosynthesis C-methylase UbiE